MIQFISYVSATKQVKQCSLKDQMDTIGPKCGQSWLMHFNWRINSTLSHGHLKIYELPVLDTYYMSTLLY